MTSTNNNIIVKATITWKTTSIDKKQEQHEMANDKTWKRQNGRHETEK